jgi:hypothetical protein
MRKQEVLCGALFINKKALLQSGINSTTAFQQIEYGDNMSEAYLYTENLIDSVPLHWRGAIQLRYSR